jgi:hypothetical protein
LDSTLAGTRTWLEARYREASLPLPAFQWVERGDALAESDGPAGALLVEDRELRQFLLLLDLEEMDTPETLTASVLADLQTAWALRSACLPAEGRGLPGGAAAWRVRVHWLGPDSRVGAWRAAILYARQSLCLLEEIPVDAAFRAPMETQEQCLDRTGVPGLLLTTRSVFHKDARETDLWNSADRQVRAALADLEAAFPQPRSRAIAQELQALLRWEAPGGSPADPGPPARMAGLTVQDVRGVRDLTLEPWPGKRPAQAWVLTGPNGSGKSSLAEAVSLKAFGTSSGLCAYLKDPDVARARTPDGYLTQYLAPLGGGMPRCGFGETPAPFRPAPDLERALEALAEADGTLAPQGGPAGFLDTPGDELGARMARSFSALATRLGAHLEAGRQTAAEARIALARRHGISAATKLLATFQEKIARARLTAALAPLPPVPADFLACRAALPGGAAETALLAAWATGTRLDGTVRLLLQKGSAAGAELEPALLPVFEEQETLGRTLVNHIKVFRATVAGLPAPATGLSAQASRWAAWLAAHPEPVAVPAPEPASPELDRLLAERGAIAEEGKRTRPRHDHLETALAFIRGHWRDHPRDCPTCGSQLAGAVEATVAGLLAEEDRRLVAQREAYAALTGRIRQLERRPADPAQACPVAPEARRQIQAVTAALLGPEASAEALLKDPQAQAALARLLAHAETPPEPDLAVPAAAPAAAACAAAILEAWREAAAALAEPEAWEQVAKEVTRRLSAVVARHLPATLEALWREIAACLSPAPWLLPAPPRFQPRTLRGTNRVEVVLEGPDGDQRLARHLLNDAQRSTLGLAWTFCQHLARARFRHAWMLLDDPAQDMDQPAFRALCRFLATLLNLYDSAGQAFTLVLLLNQEDRAMDAARELGQGLILLGWTGSQEDAAVQRIAIFGEEIRSPQPADLFPRAAG